MGRSPGETSACLTCPSQPDPASGTVYLGWSKEVNATSATQQVGRTRRVHETRAALWSGTVESWIDLHPSGMSRSEALGVFDGYQVGYASSTDSEPHAAFWNGSAESWVDLNQFLPPEYIKSTASGVWHDEHALYVVGYAATLWAPEAFFWSMPTPAPSTAMPLAIAAMVGMWRVRRRAVKAADAATLPRRVPTID